MAGLFKPDIEVFHIPSQNSFFNGPVIQPLLGRLEGGETSLCVFYFAMVSAPSGEVSPHTPRPFQVKDVTRNWRRRLPGAKNRETCAEHKAK